MAMSWEVDDDNSVANGDNETSIAETLTPSQPPPPERNEQLARVEVAVLATILALALLGNGLVARVLRRLRSRRKLTRMNTMIAHLIVADTAVALFNVLPQVSACLYQPYDVKVGFREFKCNCLNLFPTSSTNNSTFLFIYDDGYIDGRSQIKVCTVYLASSVG